MRTMKTRKTKMQRLLAKATERKRIRDEQNYRAESPATLFGSKELADATAEAEKRRKEASGGAEGLRHVYCD